MISKQTLLWILLCAVALGCWRYFTPAQKQVAEIQVESKLPDSEAKDILTTEYGKNGLINKTFFASEAKYYQSQSRSDFVQPKITMFDATGKPQWSLKSKQGTLIQDVSAHMQGDVVGKSLQPNNYLKRLNTDEATLDLKTNIVTGDKPVVIYGQDVTTRGVGFVGNLNKKTLKILDDAHAIYTTPNR
ncbi:LPS export ABC transporter periplasmic protein LptC [Dongshaea marina]|uniref:LPS export ABC transporter periplasmic protein LptC n=1 Tax=Dongshaea marina TaxID=2047966 RepID=UPI000D3E348D|nr:LPS export ABC transporter periplasmic protein LptC [Dongshaea marina]